MRKRYKKKSVSTDPFVSLKGFILDSSLPNAQELAAILGYPDTSDEVAEKEEEESDIRLEKIDHLVPIMQAYASVISESTSQYNKLLLKNSLEDVPPEMWEANRRALETITFATTMATISQLVNFGFLRLPSEIAIYKRSLIKWMVSLSVVFGTSSIVLLVSNLANLTTELRALASILTLVISVVVLTMAFKVRKKYE